MLVRPKQGFVSTLNGFDVVLRPDDVLNDTNPHVRARPDMFEEVRATYADDGRYIRGQVEEATARPGERRGR